MSVPEYDTQVFKDTSDGNKTKIVRPRPRPIKQQQGYITEKLFCCNTRLLSKNNFVQKTSKSDMMIYNFNQANFQTFGTVSALIARKNTGGSLHFSIIMSHSACRAQQCWKQDQKY